jgi:hypothetical protein
VLVYYIGGGALSIADVRELSLLSAVGIGVGVICVGWSCLRCVDENSVEAVTSGCLRVLLSY